jgi:ABC-type polysaccharide/polyol phosphate transport system ATPase subunit
LNAIELSEVTKTYRVGVGRARVREMVPSPFDSAIRRVLPRWWARDTFDALKDVSLRVPAGSAIGIVGHNGAGKTTLLRIIAGVTAPTAGTRLTSGRLAALLDVLVGFHPDLTGRENAYLLGSMLGIGRRAMGAKIEHAIEFAELESTLVDTPVKRFSAGMTSRLAFGVISSLDPEILLVDEVLSVGDANFQRKCINWMDAYRASGGTLVFVSHNLGLVRSMADRTLWLDHGRLVDDGDTSDVLPRYAKAMQRRDGDTQAFRPGVVRKHMRSRGMDRWGAGGARVEEVTFGDETAGHAPLTIGVRYSRFTTTEALFCVGFLDEGERELGVAVSPLTSLDDDNGVVRCVIDPPPFEPGIYFPVVAIISPNGKVEDRWKLSRALVVDGLGERTIVDGFGPIRIPAEWSTVRSLGSASVSQQTFGSLSSDIPDAD